MSEMHHLGSGSWYSIYCTVPTWNECDISPWRKKLFHSAPTASHVTVTSNGRDAVMYWHDIFAEKKDGRKGIQRPSCS